jgi:dTDP-3,4-didehydro-2,6-dideoxy-alpha-D-glucose 3-reductase
MELAVEMKTLKIAVMGCAAVAWNSMLPACRLAPEWDLVAVASRSELKAQQFALQFDCEAVIGYENLLHRQDIDAIYMPLPTGLHHEWIIKCLDAGKHVLAEKSIASSYSSAVKMVELARLKNLVLMEDFMFQYHSQHQFVFKLLGNKEIGDIRVFRANFGFPPLPNDNFRYNEKIGGGALLDAAGYTVRAAHFILGEDLIVKAADLFYDREPRTNIYGGAYLSNGSGISAQLGFGFDNFYQCNYEIWGSKGKIIVDRAFTPKLDYSPLIVVEKQGERHEYFMAPDNHFLGSIREFYNAIMENNGEKHNRQVLSQSLILEHIRSLSIKKE